MMGFMGRPDVVRGDEPASSQVHFAARSIVTASHTSELRHQVLVTSKWSPKFNRPAMSEPASRPGLFSRILRGGLAIVAGLWLIAEEWLWDGMLAATAWLGRLPPVRWLESQIARLPPYPALVAFAIPAIVLFPFKLIAFWLIAKGQAMLGAAVFVVAKIVGTALLARIFSLTKPALLTIGWFARAYTAFSGWKSRLYAYVKALPAYRAIRAWKQRIKTTLALAWDRWKKNS
jgi:hypothetical protein